MTSREASCHCGQLRLAVAGDPFAVSICNCREMARHDPDFDVLRDEPEFQALVG